MTSFSGHAAWAEVGVFPVSGGFYLHVWECCVTTGTTATVSFTHAYSPIAYAITRFDAINISGGNGTVVVQSQGVISYNPGSPWNFATLSSFGSADNPLVVLGGSAVNTNNFSQSTGYTLVSQPTAWDEYNTALQFKDTEDLSPVVSGSFGYQNIIGVALELSAGASGPTLDNVGGNDEVVVGDIELATYSNFTTAIETATINDGSTGVTNLSVTSAGATTANIQLASMDDWVGLVSCPFTSTNQTSQQVTVNNTDESESASRSVQFFPASGMTVTETNNFTWPAPDGSVIKGFASQPPANSQVIHPSDLNIDQFGIITTDINTDQTLYFHNATTKEGSTFLWLIESASAGGTIDSELINSISIDSIGINSIPLIA